MPARRSGFTLIELLVAMALTMFIMMILSQAFITSLEVFSGLKAIGDMQANLRTVNTLLQDDLTMDHFEGKRRLSDWDLVSLRPRQGFFAIFQGSPSSALYEGDDPPSVSSFRARNHLLYFTGKQRGNQVEKVFSAAVPNAPLLTVPTNFFSQPSDALFQPPGFFNSPWAEIAYFLVQTGTTDDASNPGATTGMPLFALYRAQYLLVSSPNGDRGNNGPNNPPNQVSNIVNYPNVSCYPFNYVNGNNLVFNAPEDVTNPVARVLDITRTPFPNKKGEPLPVGSTPPSGASVVLSNVVSFQVQAMRRLSDTVDGDFADVFPGNFDSSTSAFSIFALKISIRIWDSTTKQTRQVTLIQDM